MNILEKIALTKIKGIGPKMSHILLVYNDSVEDIFRSSKKQVLAIPSIGETIANTIQSQSYFPEAKEEYNFILSTTSKSLGLKINITQNGSYMMNWKKKIKDHVEATETYP